MAARVSANLQSEDLGQSAWIFNTIVGFPVEIIVFRICSAHILCQVLDHLHTF